MKKLKNQKRIPPKRGKPLRATSRSAAADGVSPLAPLIALCQKVRGLKSRVLVEMMKRGISGNWANLSGWLRPEPPRRTPKPETLAGLLKIQKALVK